MDRRKGKGKVSETSFYDDMDKEKEAEQDKKRAAWLKQCEESHFIRKMKNFKSREERKGKDWVKTKEENYDFYLYNDEIANEFSDSAAKPNKDFNDGKISGEEWNRLMRELRAQTQQKREDMFAAEEAEMAKCVEEYEARERQFPPEN